MSEPEALTAFLATAEHHILQAPHGSTAPAGESLISAGCYYAPRLLAAVEAVRKLVDEWEVLAPWLGRPAANAIREVISHELLGDDDSEPPRTETDCPCDDDCPCDAGRYGAACACCVAGDHDGSCASRALLGEGETDA